MMYCEKHNTDFTSQCCGANPIEGTELEVHGSVPVALCGNCRDGAGFDCEDCISDDTVEV